jgi:hypothetical protein
LAQQIAGQFDRATKQPDLVEKIMKAALISFTTVILFTSSATFGQGSELREQNMIDQSNEYLMKQQESQQVQQQRDRAVLEQKQQQLQRLERQPLPQVPQQQQQQTPSTR